MKRNVDSPEVEQYVGEMDFVDLVNYINGDGAVLRFTNCIAE